DRAQVLGLIDDEVVEAAPNARNWHVVVLSHGVAKGDHQDEAGELPKVKTRAAVACCECRFESKPDDHDGGEGKEHGLAEIGELANMLREQLGDVTSD